MNYFITYSDKKYEQSKLLALFAAKYLGKFDKCIGYSPEDIDTEFSKQHQEILSINRGNGLWLWKPYFFKRTLSELNEGDFLFYSDAGAFFIRPVQTLLHNLDTSGIWLSNIPLIEKQFTKPELFHWMSATEPHFYDSNMIQAGFIGVRKSASTVKFIDEWLEHCLKIEFLDSSTNFTVEAEENQFITHREDQSVLSLLAKKHGVKPQKDPTQFSKIPEKYKAEGRIFRIPIHEHKTSVSIILHRTPDSNLKVILNQWIFAWMPVQVIQAVQSLRRGRR